MARSLVRTLCRDRGYRRSGQVGSHIVLETDAPSHQRLVVLAHKSLRVGTLGAILRSVAVHKTVAREDLLKTL